MFEDSIQRLKSSGRRVGEPINFSTYAKGVGFSYKTPAPFISVDSLDKLRPELRSEGCMVFRLGSSEGGGGTRFALAATSVLGWGDFFLLDQELFGSEETVSFSPSNSASNLEAFRLLPSLTETSIVNLVFASGLIQSALGLPFDSVIQATGQSTFSFHFRPCHDDSTRLDHRNGQVEIDSIFFASRSNRKTLFLVEAKRSKKLESLAKDKLVYPYLALREKVPAHIDIVPVYLRALRTKQGLLEVNIAECSFRHKEPERQSIDTFSCVKPQRFLVEGFEQPS